MNLVDLQIIPLYILGLSVIILLVLFLVSLAFNIFIVRYLFRNPGNLPGLHKYIHNNKCLEDGYSESVSDNLNNIIDPESIQENYGRAWIIQKEGPEPGKRFPVCLEETTLGSGLNNAIILDDPSISGRHAKILKMKNSYVLFDLISETGTILNMKKLLRPKPLHDWDEIIIGNIILIFRSSR